MQVVSEAPGHLGSLKIQAICVGCLVRQSYLLLYFSITPVCQGHDAQSGIFEYGGQTFGLTIWLFVANLLILDTWAYVEECVCVCSS